MKVLQLISSGGYYGAEAVVVNLSSGLNALGVSSTIGVFRNTHATNLEVADAAAQRGLAVELIPCWGRADWNAVRKIRDYARLGQIDVIHAHGYKAQMYAYLASRGLSGVLVATCHGYLSRFSEVGRATFADFRQRIYGALNFALLSRFDQVVATSEILAESLRKAGVKKEKLSVIHNGVDLGRFATATQSADLEQLKAGRLAIGLVGRLTEGKGHSQLFRAMKEIFIQHPNVLVLVIGDGPLKGSLEALARELGIEESVVFTGKRSDMASLYAVLDIVVLPSLFEGLPMVILEALAAQRPVIATRVGAIPDIILDGRTGLLIAPDNIIELKAAIARLINDPDMCRSLAENGHSFLEESFSAASMAASYREIYARPSVRKSPNPNCHR